MSALADGDAASGLTLTADQRSLGSSAGLQNLAPHAAQDAARQVRLIVPDLSWGARPWWVVHVEEVLNQLLALPEAWDGRRAQRVTPEAVEGVVTVLAIVMTDTSATPQLFPLADGGLQVEWHVAHNDIEIEVDAAGEAHVLAQTSEGVDVVDDLVDDAGEVLSSTRAYLKVLSDRLRRALAAA